MGFVAGILTGITAALVLSMVLVWLDDRRLTCRECGKEFHHAASAALCEQLHRCPAGQVVKVAEDSPVEPVPDDPLLVLEDEEGILIEDWDWSGA